MDVLTITFVSASTALIAAVASPVVSVLVARQQIRASVISNNRERWVETLRDSVAEYVALVLSASIARQTMNQEYFKVLSADRALLEIAERIALVKNRIMLMINPNEGRYSELSEAIEVAYSSLISEEPQPLTKMRAETEAITRAGRAVLKAEWQRVKRGE